MAISTKPGGKYDTENGQYVSDGSSNAEIEIEAKEYARKYQIPSIPQAGRQDDCLKEILDKKEFTKPPKRVNKEQFTKALESGSVVYRGVGSSKHIEQFYNGDCFVGQGDFGNGIYMSYDKKEALGFSSNLVVSILPKDFNFAPTELRKEHEQFVKEFKTKRFSPEKVKTESDMKEAQNELNFINDFGKYCALKGYDGYITQDDKNLVVLNRGKLIIGENDEQRIFLEFD